MELKDYTENRETYLPQTFSNMPNRSEKTTAKLIRHDVDHDEGLENFIIDEDIQKTLYMTVFVTLVVFLLNTFGWG